MTAAGPGFVLGANRTVDPRVVPRSGRVSARRLEPVRVHHRQRRVDERQRHSVRLEALYRPGSAPRVPPPAMLFDPASHEPLTERPWDEAAARAAIARDRRRRRERVRRETLWPAHPLDVEDGPLPPVASLYLGRDGRDLGAARARTRRAPPSSRRDWAPRRRAACSSATRPSRTSPRSSAGRSRRCGWARPGSCWSLTGSRRPPGRRSACSPRAGQRRKPDLGADVGLAGDDARGPGDVRAHRRRSTGSKPGASPPTRLWAEWRDDRLGAGPLRQARPLPRPGARLRRQRPCARTGRPRSTRPPAELERRAIATLAKYAQREDGSPVAAALEPPAVAGRRSARSGATARPASSPRSRARPGRRAADRAARAGGELTWQAGPLAKGAGLCHGTAGNGYAFLKLSSAPATSSGSSARGRSRCTRSSRSSASRPSTAAAATPSGPATPATAVFLHDCLTATPRSPPSTTSRV